MATSQKKSFYQFRIQVGFPILTSISVQPCSLSHVLRLLVQSQYNESEGNFICGAQSIKTFHKVITLKAKCLFRNTVFSN